MSFEFTVLPDERFIEILEVWVDSPWPKTIETGYQLRDHFGWIPKVRSPIYLLRMFVPTSFRLSLADPTDTFDPLTFQSLISRLRKLGDIH